MSRSTKSPLSFKKMISSMGVLLLGTTLTVGCGGTEPESTNDSQPLSSVENPPVQAGAEQEGDVSALSACCYIACYDGAGADWRGPYPGVSYGNCANFGYYFCGQHGWAFRASKWDNC